MSEEGESNNAELLMEALINKMERMDNQLQFLRKQNHRLKSKMDNPDILLKSLGLVKATTPHADGDYIDPFRGGGEDILKSVDEHGIQVPENNEDFHDMDWGDIHKLAGSAKQAGHIGNVVLEEL
tara:strand:- start:44 stop:418 length:375 start_codon:yes stop_codon:yes gene_type:complete